MILWTDVEKAFEKNLEPFHDKSFEKTRNRRNVPQHNKGYVSQTYSQYYSKWRITETIPSKSQERDMDAHFPYCYSVQFWNS
jgi:hypothetical protein